MCGVSLKEKKSSDEFLGRLGIVSVANVVLKGMLRWYGHVDRKDVEDWVSKCHVQVCRGRGRAKKTWKQCGKCDIRKYSM